MSDKPRLLVIGNGMGSVRFLEQLFAVSFDGEADGKVDGRDCPFQVTVLSEEGSPGYNRIQLSRLLAGSIDVRGIHLQSESWYLERGITLLMGAGNRVVDIDRVLKQVTMADGKTLDYDRLVLATGSLPNQIPVPGADLEGVLAFRTLDDVHQMLDAGKKEAVVIGGGLLGLECGSGLAKRGLSVTIVDNMPIPMARQLDHCAGNMLRCELESRGIAFRSSASLQSYSGEEGGVTGVQLEGEFLPASLVVVTAGVRPNIELLQKAGLKCDRGVLVNERLETSDPGILAIGECVQMQLEGESLFFGLVAPVYQHAEIAANTLLGNPSPGFVPAPTPTSLKVDGIDLFSSGDFNPNEGDEVLQIHAPDSGVYRKLVLRDDRIKGVLLYGDVTDGLWYQALMEAGQDISAMRQQLIFGQRYLTAA